MKNKREKVNSTFIVKFNRQKKRNWSGKIILADLNEEKDFGSTMDLIKIIDKSIAQKG